MKKILLILTTAFALLLTGCDDKNFSDSKTISTLKMIESQYKTPYEQLIVERISFVMFENIYGDGPSRETLKAFVNELDISKDTSKQEAENKVINYIKKKLKWKVEGTNNIGKIVVTTFKYKDFETSYSVQTERDGDYLMIDFNDIKRIK